MADITMCKDITCKHRMKCYRHMGQVTKERQSYFSDRVRNDDYSCDHYMEQWGTLEEWQMRSIAKAFVMDSGENNWCPQCGKDISNYCKTCDDILSKYEVPDEV